MEARIWIAFVFNFIFLVLFVFVLAICCLVFCLPLSYIKPFLHTLVHKLFGWCSDSSEKKWNPWRSLHSGSILCDTPALSSCIYLSDPSVLWAPMEIFASTALSLSLSCAVSIFLFYLWHWSAYLMSIWALVMGVGSLMVYIEESFLQSTHGWRWDLISCRLIHPNTVLRTTQ